MGEDIEATADNVATDIMSTMSDENRSGWDCMPIGAGAPGRFASFYVTLPNGQTFKVQVEEVL